jgi:hypothetical protein
MLTVTPVSRLNIIVMAADHSSSSPIAATPHAAAFEAKSTSDN